VNDLAVDIAGNIYVAGSTVSDTGIATAGAYQFSRNGPADNCIHKFSPTGQRLWGTYYGGPQDDFMTAIAVTPGGEIYVGGTNNNGGNVYASAGAHQTAQGNGFIAKFSTAGQRIWGTYHGGASSGVRDLFFNPVNNRLYVAGYTQSATGIAAQGASQATHGGGNTDGYYAIFDSAGQKKYGTYFGSSNSEEIKIVKTDASGTVHISGNTASATGIATPGAFQTTLKGATDGFLAKFTPDSALYIVPSFDTILCAGDSLYVAYIAAGSFASGNTFTAELSDMSGSFASPTVLGSITATMSGVIPCVLPGSLTAGTGYRIRVVSSNPALTSADNNFNITISTSLVPSVTVNVTPGLNVGPFTPITFTAIPSGGGVNPSFQWRKNGVDIAGETNPVYVGVTNVSLMTGDKVTVLLTSSASCAAPDTANSTQQTINVNLGVNDIADVREIKLYPNPNSGKFTLTAPARAEASIEVLNVSGQAVFQTSATPVNGTVRTEISLDSKLSNGIYMIRMTEGESTQTLRFSIQR
jgi:hypothetical protein